MDWLAVITAIAQISAPIVALIALIAFICVSEPVQRWFRRHEQYKSLDPYSHDILKAILKSRLGLGSIFIRTNDIEPIIELTSQSDIKIFQDRRLVVGQSFYQLSLESLEALGLLAKDDGSLLREDSVLYLERSLYPGPVYRLTGAGDLFIRKYEKKLRREPYSGRYVDSISPAKNIDTRRKARMYREPPPYEIPGGAQYPYWVKILSREKKEDGIECMMRGPDRHLSIRRDDTLYFLLEEPIPQYPESDVISAQAISVERLGPIDNKCLRIGEHVYVRLKDIRIVRTATNPPVADLLAMPEADDIPFDPPRLDTELYRKSELS